MESSFEQGRWSGLEGLRGRLRSFLSRHCPDENEIDDVIQETYLRAVRYRGRLSEGTRLRSWTTRIALNVLADRRRRECRYVRAHSEDSDGEVFGGELFGVGEPPSTLEPPVRIGRFDIEKDDAVDLLTRILRGMRDEDRRLLGSFYGGAQSCAETARECRIAPAVVKVRLFRARRRLCRAMRHRVALERSAAAASHEPPAPATAREVPA